MSTAHSLLHRPVERLAASAFSLINETEPRPDGFRDAEIFRPHKKGGRLGFRGAEIFSPHREGGGWEIGFRDAEIYFGPIRRFGGVNDTLEFNFQT